MKINNLTFKSRYNELKDEKDELSESLYKERINHPFIDKLTIDNVIAKVFNYEPLTLMDKKFLIENFISNVYFHEDGKVDIAYTYTNSQERFDLDTIQNMSSSPLYLGPPNETKMNECTQVWKELK